MSLMVLDWGLEQVRRTEKPQMDTLGRPILHIRVFPLLLKLSPTTRMTIQLIAQTLGRSRMTLFLMF